MDWISHRSQLRIVNRTCNRISRIEETFPAASADVHRYLFRIFGRGCWQNSSGITGESDNAKLTGLAGRMFWLSRVGDRSGKDIYESQK